MAFNPFEHHHTHYDDDDEIDDSLDPAPQSMADALRVSFFVLKVAMLIVFFIGDRKLFKEILVAFLIIGLVGLVSIFLFYDLSSVL